MSSSIPPVQGPATLAAQPRAKQRILVTGGAGFVGSHLCQRLWDRGDEVLCLDDFSTGFKRNIQRLLGKPRFELIQHDVIKPYDFAVDAVYNLACPASPVHYQSDPVRTFNTSVLGAINVLEMVRRHPCKVLQSSTSEVYGDPHMHPQPEHYWGHVNPIGPRSCYDEGKRGAETLMFDYHRQYGVKIKVARIFNTYGPSMHPRDGRVVSNFIMQALMDEDITIYGDGQQTRSFCYVDDLVSGLISLMESPDDITGPINLGNPGEFTMLSLAEEVLRLTPSKSKLVFRPLPTDDPRQRRPDISLAKEHLGWAPTIPLREGLTRTIAHFRDLLDSEQWSERGYVEDEALAEDEATARDISM